MRNAIVILGLCTGLNLAMPVSAQDGIGPVRDLPTVTIDPTLAYVLVNAPSQIVITLIREPDETDRADWQRRYDEAFAEAQRRHERDYERWQRRRQAYLDGDRSTRVPTRPTAPTQDNFAFPAIETEMFFQIGPMNRFAKEGQSVYLSALRLGTYSFYGPIGNSPAGMMTPAVDPSTGVCMCMGSVRFTVAAGEIANLGHFEVTSQLFHPDFTITPPRYGDAVDPRLSAFSVRPAHYSAAGKLPNFFGATVARLHEIPGVLRYERDRVIDVATGEDVTGTNYPASAYAIAPAATVPATEVPSVTAASAPMADEPLPSP